MKWTLFAIIYLVFVPLVGQSKILAVGDSTKINLIENNIEFLNKKDELANKRIDHSFERLDHIGTRLDDLRTFYERIAWIVGGVMSIISVILSFLGISKYRDLRRSLQRFTDQQEKFENDLRERQESFKKELQIQLDKERIFADLLSSTINSKSDGKSIDGKSTILLRQERIEYYNPSDIFYTNNQKIKSTTEEPLTHSTVSVKVGKRGVLSDDPISFNKKDTSVQRFAENYYIKFLKPLSQSEIIDANLTIKIEKEFGDEKNSWIVQQKDIIEEHIFEIAFLGKSQIVTPKLTEMSSKNEITSTIRNENELIVHEYRLPSHKNGEEMRLFQLEWAFDFSRTTDAQIKAV
jgi:hypothetical protein